MSQLYSDEELLDFLINDDKLGLELLFRRYYTPLYRFCYLILNRSDLAEDVVQEVFFKLWKLRYSLNKDLYIKPYLYKAVKNKAINVLEKEKKHTTIEDFPEHATDEGYDSDEGSEDYLKKKIEEAVGLLPEKCQLVFMLSRYEGMSYQEIAEYLDISVKTVENQMGTALKKLRVALAPYLRGGLAMMYFLFWYYSPVIT